MRKYWMFEEKHEKPCKLLQLIKPRPPYVPKLITSRVTFPRKIRVDAIDAINLPRKYSHINSINRKLRVDVIVLGGFWELLVRVPERPQSYIYIYISHRD